MVREVYICRRMIKMRRILTPTGIFFFMVVIGFGLTECASSKANQTTEPNEVIPEMILINGGTFMMGSPPDEPGHDNTEVLHQVNLSSFYIGKYEVTQAEYQEIMGENPSRFKGKNLPVEYVSWEDAILYCNRRSRKEGLTPFYEIEQIPGGGTITTQNYATANGYRLPTEAQWEYAARAGTTTPFFTGDNITTDQANYRGNRPYNNNAKGIYRRRTTVVGSFPPNPWGLYDMHGNVWELCNDHFRANYPKDMQTDPVFLTKNGRNFVRRGGSWEDSGEKARSAWRDYIPQHFSLDTVGFRVVLPAK